MRRPPGARPGGQINFGYQERKEISVWPINACTPIKAVQYPAQEPMAMIAMQILIRLICSEANHWKAPASKRRSRNPVLNGGTRDETGKRICQTGSPAGSHGQHHRCSRERRRSLAEALA